MQAGGQEFDSPHLHHVATRFAVTIPPNGEISVATLRSCSSSEKIIASLTNFFGGAMCGFYLEVGFFNLRVLMGILKLEGCSFLNKQLEN